MTPFTVTGVVVHGKRLGGRLGFPTANLRLMSAPDLPDNGVYIASAQVEGDAASHYAIVNQGAHPTFPEGARTIEAHLLDFDGDLYGKTLQLCYLYYLRPEIRFQTPEALIARIAADQRTARAWIKTHVPRG